MNDKYIKNRFTLESFKVKANNCNFNYISLCHKKDIKGKTHPFITIHCKHCNRIYETKTSQHLRYKSCSYCNGHKVDNKNCLASINPKLIKEWDYSKNIFTPLQVTANSCKSAHWVCSKCKHEWMAVIHTRNKGSGCPNCVKGRNKSKSELSVLFELKYIFPEINITGQYFKLDNKKYFSDIFIASLNLIIEYDGWYYHQKRLIEDVEKSNLFVKNNYKILRLREYPLVKIMDSDLRISNKGYVNCKITVNSVLMWILNNFELKIEIKSKINQYIKSSSTINHDKLAKYFSVNPYQLMVDKSTLKKYYITQNKSIKELSKQFGLTKSVISNILKYYCITKSKKLKNNKISQSKVKNLVKISQWKLNGEFIKTYNSVKLAANTINVNASEIINAVDGRQKSCKNFLWTRNVESPPKYSCNKHPKIRKIKQLSLDNNIIHIYDSIADASRITETYSSKIILCAQGKRKTANKYKWEYA